MLWLSISGSVEAPLLILEASVSRIMVSDQRTAETLIALREQAKLQACFSDEHLLFLGLFSFGLTSVLKSEHWAGRDSPESGAVGVD
jgi:hypothetical protein